MVKKLYIVHRWEGTPEGDWYPWLKDSVKDEFEVSILSMPNPDTPKINEWVNFVRENVKQVDENTYFVGHSIGCQTILRFLETVPDSSVAGGVVLVTPWVKLTPDGLEEVEDIAQPWIKTPINWNKVKVYSKHFIAIFSDNDPYVTLNNADIFKEKLNAKIVIEQNKGHMTSDDGITEAQVVLRALEELNS